MALTFVQGAGLAVSISLLTIALNRRHFHQCSKFPGPFWWSVSLLPQIYYLVRGTLHLKILELHEQYGPIVRLAPNEVSYTDPDAWEDIYAKSRISKTQLQKDRSFAPPESGVNGLLFELDDAEHGRIRRAFSHAFSDKSIREQEPIIMKYTNQLMDQFYHHADQPIDVCQWFSFLFFDISGDLVFGETFHCLQTAALHPWVKMLFHWIAGACLRGAALKFGPLYHIIMPLVPKHLRNGDANHAKMTKIRLDKRLEITEALPDFISNVQRSMGTQNGVSYPEILETSRALVAGGSETTASFLSGVTYLLLQHQSVLVQLTNEIRSKFSKASEITMASVQYFEYLNAVINETLRIFPPLPGNIRRITPQQGHMICNSWVPGNTLVAVDVYATNHSSANFVHPEKFLPERWLETADPIFKNDKLSAVRAFSHGPRNCIGKNLAYMEMRLIVAVMLFKFDLELQPECEDWIDHVKAYGVYLKPKLMVKFKPGF